jgi:hypothetical protein
MARKGRSLNIASPASMARDIDLGSGTLLAKTAVVLAEMVPKFACHTR